jgi:hypothetical protein
MAMQRPLQTMSTSVDASEKLFAEAKSPKSTPAQQRTPNARPAPKPDARVLAPDQRTTSVMKNPNASADRISDQATSCLPPPFSCLERSSGLAGCAA